MIRKNLDDLETNGKKGDWCFLEDCTKIALRFADETFTGMVILPISEDPKEAGDPHSPSPWQWDGNKEAPTLSPSILVHEAPGWRKGWHGYLTDGKLVTV